ncbi:complex I NDUFA9 subunit family protein [Oceanomicrobium pacificus]|uniref:Sugar nucleotide-binding protein n=1 Tax=Oceanomicrobium pacificus TaxID=2692916 RepID=A0A6B0TSH0_9RHOB|nr:complex I NDUFA9 subunit family protein [Oceanomicrobium pacificus]MXU64678.1 sugar nucleotide-binding protein [Oceanomicrobium pacificus]
MSSAAPLVTIFGGSGFVGRYITQRMARAGWRVRVAVRRPEEAGFVRPYGSVGQVEPVQANIRDEASTRAAIAGAQAVINCVGILAEDKWQKFETVQAEGPARVARLAAEAGVERLVQISAIGADGDSDSAYGRSKAEGEAAVLDAFPGAVILRPSIVFGTEDGFFNKFAGMARLSPVLPVVGADTKFQPVFVDDVAAAAAAAAQGTGAGIYELGGPDVETFDELMQRMLKVVQRRRIRLHVPFFAARILAGLLDFAQTVTFGLFKNTMVTRDQVKLLKSDNVASGAHPGLEAFGIEPTPMDAVLDTYLYSYRPYGQYAEITRSAKNLKA